MNNYENTISILIWDKFIESQNWWQHQEARTLINTARYYGLNDLVEKMENY